MALVAAFCLVVGYLATETQAQCRYTVIAQKGLRVNTPEDIYVDFHECGDIVTVAATLTSLPNLTNPHDEVIIKNKDHGNEPVKITLQAKSGSIEQSDRGNPVYKAVLQINYCFGRDCGPPWQVIPTATILLNTTHGYIFMTTDRPAYRPGEKVKIALALTNQHLKPELERRPVKIVIKTPEDQGRIVVHDSDEIFVQNAFLDYDYHIPPEPLRGIWWAEAYVDGIKMAEKSFIIDTYELPTFQVKIIPKYHFVLETLTHIEGEVTAEYSYGEKVYGSYYMSFRLVRSDGTETEFHKIPHSFGDSALISRGAVRYEVPMTDLENVLREGETIRDLVESGAKVLIMASVTGHAEAVFESDVVDNIIFTLSPFNIDYSQSAKFYIQNTVYQLKATIRDAQSGLPLPDIPVKIEWKEATRRELTQSDKYGEIYMEIDNFLEETETVVISTDSKLFGAVDQVHVEFQVRKYLSGRKLGVRLNKQVAEVLDNQHITFDLDDAQPADIRFFVISRGAFVHAATKVIEAGQRNEVSTSFPVTASMVPNARVVAYYILGGELTSNSAWFDVTNECERELVITLPEQDSVEPGEPVTIEIRGAPNAEVHISAVDRAAYFVHNGTRLNRAKLWSKMEQYDTACSRKGGLDATSVFEEAGLTIRSPITPNREYRKMSCENSRKKRSANKPPSEQQVSDNELEKCETDGQRENTYGLTCNERTALIESNKRDQHKSEEFIRECITKFHNKCLASASLESSTLGRAAKAADRANEARIRVRDYFEENWIFQKRTLTNDGLDRFTKNAMDSITFFDIDAFGSASNSPMCVAETKSVKVFKNIFIQLYLPYSVRVREQAQIRFSVFNYGKREEEMDIYLRHSKELCSRFLSEEFQYLTTLRVSAHSARSSWFAILPLKVPGDKHAIIEIKADHRDSIKRKLLIEEQGQHNESSKTIVLQPGENGEPTNKTITFDIPKRSVMLGTTKCFVYAYAHPMGPSIEIDPFNDRLQNMQGYISKPAGCGEQNMIRIGPIVYIHKYRVTANEGGVTVEQQRQVVAFIQLAYTIELKWRSDRVDQKAFAVWNHYPPSTWLNAYVTKVFAAAMEFWPAMNTKPICSALDWLLGMQNEQGDFTENYRVLHKEMRGLVEDKISRAAYVSVSLVEAEITSVCPDLSGRLQAGATRANSYLKTQVQAAIGKPYTLAVGAYALALSEGRSNDARRWNQLLRDAKEHDGEYIFWRGTREKAANIETTAYALLAELQLNGINEENDELTRNIAHWLISQRNAAGGFKSTQDTVVALQALSTYMSILETSETHGPPQTNLNVKIASADEGIELSTDLRLTPENTMRRTEIFEGNSRLVARAGGITVKVAGEGTGSLAYRCVWRQSTEDGECQFNIRVEVANDESGEPNNKILKVDVSKPEGPPAQISIIDVGIPSGYKPDKDSIKQLCIEKVVDASADRYEITNNTVKFYLRNINSDGVKLGFIIKEVSEVFNRQPSYVSAYDYYEPDIRCTKFYTETDEDYQVRTSNCDGINQEICKCAEGDCPKCRTRDQQLHKTICSNHRIEHGKLCGLYNLCTNPPCYKLHRETCNRDYLYVVNVMEINNNESPDFKSFLAEVQEVIRQTAHHLQAEGSIIKFFIRKDCFDSCKDDDFLRNIAVARDREPKHYITPGRLLLVYGSHPTKDDSVDPPRYVYDLTEGGIEMTISARRCFKALEKPQKNADKLKICTIKSILKEAHNFGCD